MHTTFFNCIKNHMAYIKTRDKKRMLHSTLQLLCKAISVQIVLDVHSEIHTDLQWCVNYCFTWTKTRKLINFSQFPNKNSMKICTEAWVLICRHIQINKHSEVQRHTVTTFHYKYNKKNYWIFLGNVTRYYFQWWNKWSLCQTSLMNAAEKTIHN